MTSTAGSLRAERDGRDPPTRSSRCPNCGSAHPSSPPHVGLCPECWRWKRAYLDAVAYLARCLDDHGRLPPERAP
jgi:hypothetical protein